MAIRVASGRVHAIGPATDIYGLGAILYAALSGRPPIVGEGLIAVATATANERPPPLRSLRPEVPRALEAVVMRCLEKDPSARWASVAELKPALADCLGQEHPPAKSVLLRGLVAMGIVVVLGGVLTTRVWRNLPPEAVQNSSAPPPSSVAPNTLEPGRDGSVERLFERGKAASRADRFREAAALYREAAETGYPDAMVNLGVMLEKGQGVTKDEVQAVEWYRRAADKGQPDAMVNLGLLLLTGRGVTKDEAQAVEWFHSAADKGHLGAMYNLANVLVAGRGVPKDAAQAAELFRRAAENGHPGAMYNLGVLLVAGQGVTKDEAQAVEWYRRAADKGHPGAMFNLGAMLEKGRGVTRDEAQGVEWYRRAAERGRADAMFNLGVILSTGQGVTKDEAQAVEWYRRAAHRGHPLAVYNLANMLVAGQGVPKDEAQAVKLFRHAAENGDPRVREAAKARLLQLGQAPRD
ncbi:MAG: SEL1-like repeat protein [Planctomycetes bacterium]|nr:SEL1-like repeat protein [Planctomycetota bacterium]